MKLVRVSQRVPSAEFPRGSPARLKPAGRPVVNPACVWGNPGCGARGIKDAGRVLSPEICIVVDSRIDTTPRRRGKADTLHAVEGSSPRQPAAVLRGHHRGLRPGHASTGETWELGRSDALLEPRAGTWETGLKISQAQRRKPSASAESESKGGSEVPDGEATNRSLRDGVSEVLVDHSTDGRAKVRTLPVREGGEVRPKRPAVGKVKPGSASDGEKHARDSSS